MAKNTKLHLDDIEIVATLVAKILRDRGEVDGPGLDDYVLGPVHGNGSTALEVRLKLTKALTADLIGNWWPGQDLEALVSLAGEIADAVAEARSDIEGLQELVAEVARDARRQVANARRRGLRYRLVSVTPSDVDLDTPRAPCATMRIEMLNRALAPETVVFDIECMEDIDETFCAYEAEQRTRAEAKTALEDDLATGAIDAVVLRALEQRGIDVPDVLARMHETDYILDVDVPGEDRRMPLYWDDGVVRASITLADGTTWNKGCITFNAAPKELKGKFTGKPLKKFFDHPYLGIDTLVLRSHSVRPGGFAMVTCTDRLLRFDARTGHVWDKLEA